MEEIGTHSLSQLCYHISYIHLFHTHTHSYSLNNLITNTPSFLVFINAICCDVLPNQITQCSERFAPSNGWYIHTVVKVFELAGDKVKSLMLFDSMHARTIIDSCLYSYLTRAHTHF